MSAAKFIAEKLASGTLRSEDFDNITAAELQTPSFARSIVTSICTALERGHTESLHSLVRNIYVCDGLAFYADIDCGNGFSAADILQINHNAHSESESSRVLSSHPRLGKLVNPGGAVSAPQPAAHSSAPSMALA